MSAIFSPCQRYRYVLHRGLTRIEDFLEEPPSPVMVFRPVVFVMLNPSTADATKDDPTIRRCISFAEREGANHMVVVNLFGYRATDPAALREVMRPIGDENDMYVKSFVTGSSPVGKPLKVIAAWGAHPWAEARAKQLFERRGIKLWCLGRTKYGQPRHPLYVSADQPLEEFEI